MALVTTSQDDLVIIKAMQENMAAHMLFLPERMPSCTVLKAQQLTIVSAHIPDTTCNLVFGAQLQEDNVHEVVDTTISYFNREDMPFAWWVGPEDTPSNLSQVLHEADLVTSEVNLGMYLSIEQYGYEQIELRIERVLERNHIEDYISVLIEAHEDDALVYEWYDRLHGFDFSLQDYEQCYVGYLDETPVSCGTITLHSDVAGIYNVVTKQAYRKRGFATAMLQELLMRANEAGYTTATLIAQKNAVSLYERMGFERVCEFKVFEAR